jgi:hypothetical protein
MIDRSGAEPPPGVTFGAQGTKAGRTVNYETCHKSSRADTGVTESHGVKAPATGRNTAGRHDTVYVQSALVIALA